MKIGELFVDLGIKGKGPALDTIGSVKKGMGELASMSLEAKAAIVGAIYALERMMSSSARAGTDLLNFGSLTGLSTQRLQEWQYAARQAGVDSEEFTGSLKNVQNAMTNMLLGKGAPEGMAMLANKVGFDPAKARDTFYVLEQLQKFAREVPNDVGNAMIKSFGVGDETIAAMRRNAFRPEVMSHAPKVSDNEIGQLNKVDVAIANLGAKMKMAFMHLTAKEGLPIIKEISNMTDQVIKLMGALTMLADKTKVFQLLGKSFEGWAMILGLINDGITDINKTVDENKKRNEKNGDGNGLFPSVDRMKKRLGVIFGGQQLEPGKNLDDYISPSVKGGAGGSNQNININQNLNFQHDGKDAHKTGQSVHKAIQGAARQMQAQKQGT